MYENIGDVQRQITNIIGNLSDVNMFQLIYSPIAKSVTLWTMDYSQELETMFKKEEQDYWNCDKNEARIIATHIKKTINKPSENNVYFEYVEIL